MTGRSGPGGLRLAGTITPLTSDASCTSGGHGPATSTASSRSSARTWPRTSCCPGPARRSSGVGSWWVGDLDGAVVGCAALRDFGGGLGELRSLSVVAEAHGRGLGEFAQSTPSCARRDASASPACSRSPATGGYFARHGFVELDMDDVPDVLQADRVPWPARSGAGHAMELSL